jgi:Rrf2 family iron-sulfur cluster assembly transcriptional regulator
MQLSTRGRYAVMAMVDLAAQVACCGPVSLACIAERQQLSLCYLEQLFGGLRRAGLVTSARGPGGGYRLARPAGEISIADVIAAVDEPVRATRCTIGTRGCLRDHDGAEMACATHDLWAELGTQIDFFLGGVSLDDVVHGRVLGRAVRLCTAVPA